ncbi:MAG: PucR family transcriptional regulator [Tissierellia bacterium]|nr:PucR family transcriptional regulator [Tissierellia bacterium]
MEKEDVKELVKKLDKKFNSEFPQIKFGISLKKDNFKELQTALDESKQIAKIANEKISFLEDLPGERFLLDISENEVIKKYFKNIINSIKSYDEEHGTELLKTLSTYVANDLKRQKTAEIMHIHIETLRYRLNKVEELTNLDLNNSKDLMKILIANELNIYL